MELVWSIIGVVVFFGLGIWAIIANAVSNHKSEERKQDIRFKLNFIRIGMTKEQVISILGKGIEIDWDQGQEIKRAAFKNSQKEYLFKNLYMDSNPYYSIDVPKGYECLYYGGETFHTSYNGYKQTDTRSYWGIALYFKNGILEYTS